MPITVGFVGCGNLGRTLLAGLLEDERFANANFFASVRTSETRHGLQIKFPKLHVVDSNEALVKSASVVILG